MARKEDSLNDIIRVDDQFYVLTRSPMVDDRTRVLKQGETFAVFDRYGDIQPILLSEHGVYYEGTRFLSRLELSIADDRPMLLSSTLKADNALFAVDLTNPDVYRNGEVIIPRGTLHLLRTKFLWQGVCYERLCISNHECVPIDVALSFRFEADFADIFEVRGRKRAQKGRLLQETIEVEGVHFAYVGLDGVIRRTHVECSPQPQTISSSMMGFEIRLQPKEEATFSLIVSCESAGRVSCRCSYDHAFHEAEHAMKTAETNDCAIGTSNEQFNEWLNRSLQDIHMMVTETSEGPYPYAGVPWFSAPFGRDGIITALEYLWVNPRIAKGVYGELRRTCSV